MNLELIPVVELFYLAEKMERPKGPSSEYPKEWEVIHQVGLKEKGFEEAFTLFEEASFFYRLKDFSNKNLKRLIEIELEQLTEDEIALEADNVFAMVGGYVLRIDGKNVLYPQCCGDLNDLHSWEDLLDENCTSFWNGHPTPTITQKENKIIFNCKELTDTEEDEIAIDRQHLKAALIHTKQEVLDFSQRINSLGLANHIEDLGERFTYYE